MSPAWARDSGEPLAVIQKVEEGVAQNLPSLGGKPSYRQLRVLLVAGEESNQILCLTLRWAHALWTLEIASGLRVKLRFRKVLQNELSPGEM